MDDGARVMLNCTLKGTLQIIADGFSFQGGGWRGVAGWGLQVGKQ